MSVAKRLVVTSFNVLNPVWDEKYKTMPVVKEYFQIACPDERKKKLTWYHDMRMNKIADTICGWLGEGNIVATQEMWDELVEIIVRRMNGRVRIHRGYNKNVLNPNQCGLSSVAESRTTFIPDQYKSVFRGAETFDTSDGNGYVKSELYLDGEKVLLINVHISWLGERRRLELRELVNIIETSIIEHGYNKVIVCGDFNKSHKMIDLVFNEYMSKSDLSSQHVYWNWSNDVTRPEGKSDEDQRIDHFLYVFRAEPGTEHPYTIDNSVLSETGTLSDHLAIRFGLEARL